MIQVTACDDQIALIEQLLIQTGMSNDELADLYLADYCLADDECPWIDQLTPEDAGDLIARLSRIVR